MNDRIMHPSTLSHPSFSIRNHRLYEEENPVHFLRSPNQSAGLNPRHHFA